MAKRKPDRAIDIGGTNAIKPIKTKLKNRIEECQAHGRVTFVPDWLKTISSP